MSNDPQPWIDALHHSNQRLTALVGELDSETVRGPSYDDDWTIADLLSHLGSGAEHNLLMVNAAVSGTAAPGHEQMQPIWDAWNAKTPDQQLADVLPSDARSLARLDELTETERERAHVEFVGLPLDLAGVVGLRLAEHALHVWDLAVMRDASALVAADAVSLIFDNTLLRTAKWGAKAHGKHFTLAITTTDPERTFTLAVADHAVLTHGSPDKADATLSLTAEQFVRIVYGRLDDTSTVTLTGDSVTIDDLLAVFPGL